MNERTYSGRFFAPRRIGHANLYVGNFHRSMAFYIDVAGVNESRRFDAYAGFLTNGNTHHDLGLVDVTSKAARKSTIGINHLAWELETQVDLVAGYRKAIADRLAFDMTVDHKTSHSLYLKDPDGNLNEIYADTRMRWWENRDRRTDFGWKPGDVEPDAQPNYMVNPEVIRVPHAVFHPLRITGVCVAVENYAACVDFYAEVVGLRPVSGGKDAPLTVFDGRVGHADLILVRAEGSRRPGLHHMNFVCRDEADLDISFAAARAKGIPIVADIDDRARRAVVVADPDGLKLNFYVDRAALKSPAADVYLI